MEHKYFFVVGHIKGTVEGNGLAMGTNSLLRLGKKKKIVVSP